VKLVVCRAGTDKLKYYEVVLEEVIIADYAQCANAGVPMEVVQLNMAVSRPPIRGRSELMVALVAM
jgi:type VI protein secretion system component Hcp